MRGPRTLPLLRGLACASWLALGGTGCSSETASGIGETGSDATATTTGSSGTSGSSVPVDDTSLATGSDTGSVFLPNPDLGEGSECDYFIQDCSSGFKCMPWSNDGGAWNAAKCVPIVEDPAGVDETCHVVGSAKSGVDDCDFGLMCWEVDPVTNTGHCVPLCFGSWLEFQCSDPRRLCDVAADAVVALCLPYCNPLAPDCAPGEACHRSSSVEWSCEPDVSGDAGARGDPCIDDALCDPGLTCVDADVLPPRDACMGAPQCCTELCNVTDPAGDRQCTGFVEGETCRAWYLPGDAPLGLEHLGACALPR